MGANRRITQFNRGNDPEIYAKYKELGLYWSRRFTLPHQLINDQEAIDLYNKYYDSCKIMTKGGNRSENEYHVDLAEQINALLIDRKIHIYRERA